MAPPLLFAAGTAVQVAGQLAASRASSAAGQAAYQTAEYNAAIAARNAAVAENEAALRERVGQGEQRDFTNRFRALQASAGTQYRASGVVASSGTPLHVMMRSQNEADEQRQMIGLATATDAQAIREKGINQQLQGQLTLLEGQAQRKAYRTEARGQALRALTTAAFGAQRYRQIV